MFFGQQLGPNDFTNKGPRIFFTSDLGGLIDNVRTNKLLDSVTIPMQQNTKDQRNNWYTHHVNGQRDSSKSIGEFYGAVPMPSDTDLYSQPPGNITVLQTLQGRI